MVRRPNNRAGYDASPKQIQKTRAYNRELRFVQGFRLTVNPGNSVNSLTLNSAGKFLLGIALIPALGGVISDTAVSLLVNNNNLLTTANAQNLNPNFVQGMIFFPTPQPLVGNDTIQLNFSKTDAGTVIIYADVFYQPQI